MTATIEIDESGRIVLPESAIRALGLKRGEEYRADISESGIRMMKPDPETEPFLKAHSDEHSDSASYDEREELGIRVTESGMLIISGTGKKIDAGAAIRAERDSLAERALPRD